jgi:hypothetical protein
MTSIEFRIRPGDIVLHFVFSALVIVESLLTILPPLSRSQLSFELPKKYRKLLLIPALVTFLAPVFVAMKSKWPGTISAIIVDWYIKI